MEIISKFCCISSWSKPFIVLFILLIGGAVYTTTSVSSRTRFFTALFPIEEEASTPRQKPVIYHLHCPQNVTTDTPTCTSRTFISPSPSPSSSSPVSLPINAAASSNCPSYFRWIYEDLRPWSSTGITEQILESSKPHAAFRLVVIDGRAYLDKYHGVFQTRDVFTLWGILQLLNRYPGRVRDFDLMFNCEDTPVIRTGANGQVPPPPLFRYCKDEGTVDIVFPDWSFWGWPEVNIKPWMTLIKELKDGNKGIKWKDRDPNAYWKGNPWVASTRQDLMKCNVSKDRDWNARLYAQDWTKEARKGFKMSNLASQCTHRFKIYIEGRAWSVSEKYILACDSPTLYVQNRFHDFFNRGLIPGHHYLPIRADDKCRSIKAAVDWGNAHPDKAQAIGKAGSSFIQEELNMDYVYDYMFHLLNKYSKLLKYRPSIPKNAVELCLESMACSAEGKVKAYMMESMVNAPHDLGPCMIQQPPFSPNEFKELTNRKSR